MPPPAASPATCQILTSPWNLSPPTAERSPSASSLPAWATMARSEPKPSRKPAATSSRKMKRLPSSSACPPKPSNFKSSTRFSVLTTSTPPSKSAFSPSPAQLPSVRADESSRPRQIAPAPHRTDHPVPHQRPNFCHLFRFRAGSSQCGQHRRYGPRSSRKPSAQSPSQHSPRRSHSLHRQRRHPFRFAASTGVARFLSPPHPHGSAHRRHRQNDHHDSPPGPVARVPRRRAQLVPRAYSARSSGYSRH